MLIALHSHFRSTHFWRNISLSGVVSLLSAHLVVSFDQRYTLGELWSMPRYYYSMLLTAFIALVLIEFVHMVSRRLYRKFRAEGLGARWMTLQLLLGVGLTLVLELLMASLLYYYHGLWIWETMFFQKLFLPISMFVLIINLFFAVYYLYQEPATNTLIRYKLAEPLATGSASEEKLLGKPALLYVAEGSCWSIDFNLEKRMWPDSLDASHKRLGSQDYFRGQRDWLVHRSVIVRARRLSGKRLELETSIEFPMSIVVARRRVPLFKRWWSGDIHV